MTNANLIWKTTRLLCSGYPVCVYVGVCFLLFVDVFVDCEKTRLVGLSRLSTSLHVRTFTLSARNLFNVFVYQILGADLQKILKWLVLFEC